MPTVPRYTPRLRIVAMAVGLAVALQAGVTVGGASVAPRAGLSVIGDALAVSPPSQCPGFVVRHQKDNFGWAGSGAYRLHGWLFYDEAFVTNNCVYRQWHYGEDSRYCDGCAYKPVTTQTLHGKYWVCGTLRYDSTLTQYNVAYTYLTPGVWENYKIGGFVCGPQASLSGHQDKAGVFSYDYYLSY